jgi:hypothetical protein
MERELYMADPRALNEVIWFSVSGAKDQMPLAARLPAFNLMTAGLGGDEKENEEAENFPRGVNYRRGN